MFYAQHIEPKKPKKLPWYGRWSNRLLVFLTTICILLALGLVAVGAAMMALNKVLSRTEVKDILNDTKFNGDLRVGNVLNNLPVLTLCVGAIVLILAIFVCCARRKRNRICLTVGSIIILWFLIVQILTCAMWVVMKNKFENDVEDDMLTSFEQYRGNDTTKGWDLLHLGFQCCSMNVITSSSNQDTFNVTVWWGTRADTSSTLDLVPGSCCTDATEDNYDSSDSDCTRILLTHNKKSCFHEMVAWLEKFWNPAIGLSATLIAIEVLLIFLSCVFCCGVRQSREIKY